MRTMFNVILYVLTIKLSVANLQPVESVEECQHGCSEDCSTYTITMANNNCKLHIPEDCLNYEFDGKGHCDGITFPKTCTFTLKYIPPANNNTTVDSFLSVISRGKPKLPKPDQTDEEAMTQWATVAIGKAMLYFDTPCKPETVGKPAGRHMDCDTCWAGVWPLQVPYPCNCNCRGWNQVVNLCFQPCHERLPYSYDSGLYCHKPCDQPGQNTNTVGCGLGHDRVCMKDSGACVSRHVMRAVDIAAVLMNIVPGLKAGFKGAKAAWIGAGGKAAGWTAAKKAMGGAAKAAAKKFANTVGIDDAFTYMEGAKDRILEDAAVRFMAANPPNDDTDVLLEIAKMADPTGVVSMVAGWIPPASCDVQVCSVDDCEALTDVLPTYDGQILDLGGSGCTSSSKCAECQGDCDRDDDCQSGLRCFQRTNSGQIVPGCGRSGYVRSSSDHDYCYKPSKHHYRYYRVDVTQAQEQSIINQVPYVYCIKEIWFYDLSGSIIVVNPAHATEQTRWSDNHRASNIVTHPPRGDYCSQNGVPTGWIQFDLGSEVAVGSYQIKVRGIARHDPQTWALEGSKTTAGPWTTLNMQRFDNLPWNPTTMKFNIGSTEVVNLGSSGCTSSRKCGPCEGDCDSDDDCQSGLKCYQRTNSGQTVPGCAPTGYFKSTSDHDYCYAPTSCSEILVGDGNGGHEHYLTTTETYDECVAYVQVHKPEANGATWGVFGKGRDGQCYAEFNMSGANGNDIWQTCILA